MTYIAVAAAVTRADIPALCADLADRLRANTGDVVVCDLTAVTAPDLVTVEALARLRLTARRHGRAFTIRGCNPNLGGLIGLLGLGEALSEAGREPEQRKQAGGVEEVVDGRDPPA
jgi:anti-anti-sigma regulatory factor